MKANTISKFLSGAVVIALVAIAACNQTSPSLISYVNTFIGTGGHGHTFPGATAPFGMVQLSPDTRLEGWDGCSGYHYSDSVIYGFSHTHLSGTGVSDYGDVLLMPGQGEVLFNNGADGKPGYASAFNKQTEKASPGLYEVNLSKHDIDVRLTSTLRTGIHEYTFSKSGKAHVILDLQHRDQVIDADIIVPNENRVEGVRVSKAWAQEQHVYFSMEFSAPLVNYFEDSSAHEMALIFNLKEGEKLLVKVGISAVSIQGARNNLKQEAPHGDFDKYLNDVQLQWEKALSKIEVKDRDKEKLTIFYSALYHSMIAPNTFSDVDGKYRGMDRVVHQSDHPVYTVFSLWDTFRATHPLFTIIEQERTGDFIKTFLKQYEDGGELPIWELAGNYTGCMIGYHAIPVIADAQAKGVGRFDYVLALRAMINSAYQDKLGLPEYRSKGYIAMADDSESVSKTLEYSYDDWCIALMAQMLDDTATYNEFIERAQYYKNLFNPAVGFMQSKTNGAWSYGFDPTEVNFNFTEANSWQYSMFAPQDIAGMIALYGGMDSFEKKLDELFNTEMELSGREQADITGLIGQYAHGNEPSHHMAYLYNYIGKAHKTQQRVAQILDELYTAKPDGLSGNEDCGQMSSWYVLSAMGFYSVTPGMDYYAIGSPQFGKATINLENGKTFTIKTKGKNGPYIQSATLNGKPFNKSYLWHKTIMEGGELVFKMGEEPNENWGSEDLPKSEINEEDRIVAVPYFTSGTGTFVDSMKVEIKGLDPNDQIFYSLNDEEFVQYMEPFYVYENATIDAYAQRNGKMSKVVKDVAYRKVKGGRNIKLISEYSNQYAAGGDNGLIDFVRGGKNFRTGMWQGYWDQDFQAIVSLNRTESVNRIAIGALQDIKSWIWYPKSVTFSISDDGKNFEFLSTISNEFSDKEYGAFTQEFAIDLPQPKKAKFIKVQAESFGKCPDWHLGNGNPTWLFFDEITVE